MLARRFESMLLLSGSLGLCPLLAFEPGDFARLEVSLIQFRRLRRWFMKGWLRRRCLGTKPLGCKRSVFVTTWSMLLRERRRSRSLAGGGGLDDELEFRARLGSIGGRGFSADGRLGMELASGS